MRRCGSSRCRAKARIGSKAYPPAWFDRLALDRIEGLRLHYAGARSAKEDRKRAGFAGGGGRWLIEAVRGTDTCDYWESRWQVGDRDAADKKMWNVTYGRTGEAWTRRREDSPKLADAKADLAEILADIGAFADRHSLTAFAPSFRRARQLLDDPNPLAGLYHTEFAALPRLPLTAAQLLGAAQTAWLFGGMGSWNDLGFEGDEQKEYDVFSDALFVRLISGIVAAANATYSPMPQRPRPIPPSAPAPAPAPAATEPTRERGGWLTRLFGGN